MLAQIMREVAEDAKKSNEEAQKRYFEDLQKGVEEQQVKWADRINENAKHKPELIIIAGPNGAIDDAEARPLFRLSGGQIARQYPTDTPEWESTLLSDKL